MENHNIVELEACDADQLEMDKQSVTNTNSSSAPSERLLPQPYVRIFN